MKSKFDIVVDAAKCCGCLVCQLRCSDRFEKEFNLSKAKIRIRRSTKNESYYSIAFTEECDACGICARHCPYEALILEKREVA
ncbi:MAG: 4Fe-4S binding protein [Desulfatiglans sp.]|nr:4Fe-4S binding protein [Thermodesulfobacteriota bacterium]MEE4351895.1 4Fe-4S binding protein [Desulfatiglans sp.]